jgi:hypothetical protein
MTHLDNPPFSDTANRFKQFLTRIASGEAPLIPLTESTRDRPPRPIDGLVAFNFRSTPRNILVRLLAVLALDLTFLRVANGDRSLIISRRVLDESCARNAVQLVPESAAVVCGATRLL